MSVSKQIDVLVMCFCLTSYQALEFILGWLTAIGYICIQIKDRTRAFRKS